MTISPRRAAIALNTFVAPALETRRAPVPVPFAFIGAAIVSALLGAALVLALPAPLAPATGVYSAVALTETDGNAYASVMDSGLTLDDCRAYAATFATISCELDRAAR